MEWGSRLFCGLNIEWEVILCSVNDLYRRLSVQGYSLAIKSSTHTKFCVKSMARHAALDLWRNRPRGIIG